MASSLLQTDVEKSTINNNNNVNNSNSPMATATPIYKTDSNPFIGRLGGNQAFVLDRGDAANAEILREQPNGTPCMTIREQFDLQGFRSPGLWKAALVEGMGKKDHLP
jgi:hypothetical protein